jgi:hypothetical protein
VTGFAVVDVKREMGAYDWRLADTNIWKVERMLLDYPHQQIVTSDARYEQLKRKYRIFRESHNGQKPIDYRGREHWTPLPDEFLAQS